MLYITSPWLTYFVTESVPFNSLHPFCAPPRPLNSLSFGTLTFLSIGQLNLNVGESSRTEVVRAMLDVFFQWKFKQVLI